MGKMRQSRRQSTGQVHLPKLRGSEFERGARAAADVAAQYNATSSHPYRLDDCILGKLNLRQRVPRRNPTHRSSKTGES